jgi:hypothetical protein
MSHVVRDWTPTYVWNWLVAWHVPLHMANTLFAKGVNGHKFVDLCRRQESLWTVFEGTDEASLSMHSTSTFCFRQVLGYVHVHVHVCIFFFACSHDSEETTQVQPNPKADVLLAALEKHPLGSDEMAAFMSSRSRIFF